jgi:hypothetical protein
MRIVIRVYLGVALIVGFATASGAATLSVGTDKLTYAVGETITLTIFGDDEGTTAFGVFGRLVYNGYLVDNPPGFPPPPGFPRSQTTLTGEQGVWTPSTLDATDTDANSPTSATMEVFDQVNLDGWSATNLPDTFSTVTLIARNAGILDLNWDTTTPNYELRFFGLTSAPGASVTIVPEPRTAALFALGLLGLAGWRRVRA